MQKEIIEFYQQLGNKKKTCLPEIRVTTGNAHPTWIDDIYEVKENLFVTLSTNDDKCKRSILMLSETEQKALHTRLQWMANKKDKKAA